MTRYHYDVSITIEQEMMREPFSQPLVWVSLVWDKIEESEL